MIKSAVVPVAAGVIAALAVAGTAHASTGYTGAGISLVPGSSNGWLTTSIARGAERTFTFRVSNTGTVSEKFTMFASGAGGVYSPSSGSDYIAAQPRTPLDSWNHFSAVSFTLTPGAAETVTDTIAVPVSAILGLQPAAPGVPSGIAWNTVWAFAQPAAPQSGQVTGYAAAGVREYVTVTS